MTDSKTRQARSQHAKRAVVIGGGVAGLATATLLARDGHRVTLYEKNAELGGRAATETHDGFRFETGPSWYLMPEVFEHYFELAGSSVAHELELVTLDPAYRVFSEPAPGDAHPERTAVTIPYGRDRVREVFASIEPGAGRALDEYLDSARDANRLAIKYFLYNPFTRLKPLLKLELLRRLPTLCKLLFTPLNRYVEARVRNPKLRQILGYQAVFLGTDPAAAPAIYHLMSELDLGQGVQYPMGGFTRLVERLEHLARAAGVEIVTSVPVTKIRTETTGRARGRAIGVTVREETPGTSAGADRDVDADIVVSGADLHWTETELLPRALQSYPERWWRRRTSGPGAILVLLGVQGELPELPHHSLFFTRDWHENFQAIFGADAKIPDPASIYVCKPSATDPDVAPTGDSNLFVLVPIPADENIGAAHDDERVTRTVDTVIDQIATWAGLDDLRSRIVTQHVRTPADFAANYHSWRGGMLGPAHILSQSAMFRAQNQSKRVEGLYYAGATTAPGVGVPMCLISAELVLKRVRGDHSAGPLSPYPVARISRMDAASALLRARGATTQAGFTSERIPAWLFQHRPILIDDGEAHDEHRKQLARFFAPKVLREKHGEYVAEAAREAVVVAQSQGGVLVDELALHFSVRIASHIVGLTESPVHEVSNRLVQFFQQPPVVHTRADLGRTNAQWARAARDALGPLAQFYRKDVKPAIKARRRERRDDIISFLIDKGYSDREILMECLTYGTAGMVTTREFISIACVQLMEHDTMRERFLAGSTEERSAILHEVIRLEPPVGHLYRRVAAEESSEACPYPAGTLVDIDVTSANLYESVFGGETECLRPDRELRGADRAGLSFGDGAHRCPGQPLAMLEAEALLLPLLQANPHVTSEPRIEWDSLIEGYQVRGFELGFTA